MEEKIYPLEFLYDGSCPLCRSDVARLRKADRNNRLEFIDITEADFDPDTYGRSLEMLMARIHARRADGLIVEGPEVFRLAMAAIGLGWLVAPTRWPLFNIATEVTYSWFARNRPGIANIYSKFSQSTNRCNSNCSSETD